MGTATLGHALDQLLTPRCLHCAGVATSGEWRPYLCGVCGAEMVPDRGTRRLAGALHATALLRYAGPARSLIRALKFDGNRDVGLRLGQAMRRLTRDIAPGPVAIVPIPLHWRRRWWRGHNQAAVIARGIAGARPGFALGRPLRRRRATRPQVGLGRGARCHNVDEAFVLRSTAPCAPPVLLVDDVVTTGATLGAAAAALWAQGAVVLGGLAAARAPLDDEEAVAS